MNGLICNHVYRIIDECFCFCSHMELCDLDAFCVEICASFSIPNRVYIVIFNFICIQFMVSLCTLHSAHCTNWIFARRKTTNERSLYNVWMITDYGCMHCRWLFVCLKRWKRACKYSFLLLISVFVVWASNCTPILFPYYYYHFAFFFPFFFYSFLFLLSGVSTGFFLKILFLRFSILLLLWNKIKCIIKRLNNEHWTTNPQP